MARLLADLHGRVIDYLRVSITDLCNLRCTYCRPPEGVKLTTHREILRYEEILTIVNVAQEMGVRKVRITGGEPLVRRGVVEFVSRLTSMSGIEDVGLTTNGVRLALIARELCEAGLKRINVSLDSLRPEVFRQITGFDGLSDVKAGIESALKQGFNPVKINVVLLKGINEDDTIDFARLTVDRPLDVRFIERMPFGADVPEDAPDSFKAVTALTKIREELGALEEIERDSLDGPARMFRLAGAKGRIGIIDPITGHFCGSCNRLRLTPRGSLRPCLLSGKEIDVKGPLRNGASREQIADLIRSAVMCKPAGHETRIGRLKVGMNQIGG